MFKSIGSNWLVRYDPSVPSTLFPEIVLSVGFTDVPVIDLTSTVGLTTLYCIFCVALILGPPVDFVSLMYRLI